MSKSILGGLQSCLFDLPTGREFARLPKILLRMAIGRRVSLLTFLRAQRKLNQLLGSPTNILGYDF